MTASRTPAADVVRSLAGNLHRAGRRAVSLLALPRRGGYWLRLRLGSRLGELRGPSGLRARGSSLGLLEVLQTLAAAGADPHVRGVLVQLDGGLGEWSRRQTLRRALLELRATGKPVVAYAETLETGDLFVASAASKVWIAPAGSVHLTGLRLDSVFLRGLLDRLDIQADVVRVGTHKGAAEILTREGMSPEQREQMELLLDDLFGALVAAISEGRGIAAERVRELIDQGLFAAPAAQAAGLVDGLLYPDELEKALAALSPAAAERPIDAAAYWSWRVAHRGWLPLRGAARVAYVVARGTIRRGRGLRGIATEPVRSLLRRVREDDAVRGVVLRLDSPGGDGLASDLIWREVSLVASCKPVVVCMGDVAASGGYYIATAASSVLAEAGTLTGSIGVVGGKLDLSGLYERFGVRREALERGARAGLFSEMRGFTPDERSAFRSELQRVYDTFLSRVADGRKLTPEALQGVAQGRVFSGARAQQLGLVDGLGGPLEALREVVRRAGLGEHERIVVDVHPRLPPFAGLRSLVPLMALRLLDGDEGRP